MFKAQKVPQQKPTVGQFLQNAFWDLQSLQNMFKLIQYAYKGIPVCIHACLKHKKCPCKNRPSVSFCRTPSGTFTAFKTCLNWFIMHIKECKSAYTLVLSMKGAPAKTDCRSVSAECLLGPLWPLNFIASCSLCFLMTNLWYGAGVWLQNVWHPNLVVAWKHPIGMQSSGLCKFMLHWVWDPV